MGAEIQVVRDLNERIDGILDLYASAWWARTRSRDDVRLMLSRTEHKVGLVDAHTDQLVGFCRVLTDGVFQATILDVIVHPSRRGEGLGERLMNEVLRMPEVLNAASVELVCQPDHVRFYERWGFTDEVGGSRLMRLRRPRR